MVELLKQIDSNRVQYIILCLESVLTRDRKYYAFRSGNHIEDDLQKQKANVFQYIGEDKWLEFGNCRESSLKTKVVPQDDGYQIVFEHSYKTVSDEIIEALTWHSVYAIQFCKSHNIKYVVTPFAQEIENKVGKHIIGWRFNKENYAKPMFSDEFKKLIQEHPDIFLTK